MANKGRLIVLSGPSGVGKNTITRELFKQRGDMRFSVSATTRAPRKGEREGIDYYFIGTETFRRMVATGEFLESAEVHGHFYGTPRGPVEKQLKAGYDVLLDIDSQGGFQVFASGIECLSIFLLPPSMQELSQRLTARSSETEATFTLRLRNAGKELEAAVRYDYVVVNNQVTDCVEVMKEILNQTPQAERFRAVHSASHIARLKEEFASC